jgi:MATE family multidrug resistance protein
MVLPKLKAAIPLNSNKISTVALEVRSIVALAAPMILTHWAWIAIGITDLFMIAWISPEALAAGGLAQMHYAFFAFGFSGVLSGALPIMSQHIGAGNHGKAATAFRQSVLLALLLSVIAYIGIWPADQTILLAGQSEAIAKTGADYIRVTALIIPAIFVVGLMRHFASSHGRPRAGLIPIAIGIVVNGLLNYGLMFGEFGLPRLELMGAAWSSVISYWFVAILMFAILAVDRILRGYFPFRGVWSIDRKVIREIIYVGIPIGLTALSEVGVFIASSFVIGHFGVAQVGGNSIAGEVAGVAYAIPVGMQQATIVRVGWALGAADAARARLTAWTSVGIASVVGVVVAVTIWFNREGLVALILRPAEKSDPLVAEAAVGVIAVVALYQLVDLPQACVNGALRGMKDTRWPLFVFIPSFWIFGAAVALILGFYYDLKAPGIWMGLSCGIALSLVLLTWRLVRQLAKLD